MSLIDKDNIYKQGYVLAGVLSALGYTILMFEDPFLFLGEDDEHLMRAEQDDSNELYRKTYIESGTLNGQQQL